MMTSQLPGRQMRGRQLASIVLVVGVFLAGVGLLVAQEAGGVFGPRVDPTVTELMPSNGVVLADEDSDYPDWLEIHNPGVRPVNLGDFLVQTDAGEEWSFPKRELGPGEYVVVFASGKDRTGERGEIHTSFTLEQAGGEFLIRSRDSGDVLQTVTFPEVTRNASYGSGPSGWCFFAEPTPSQANTTPCFGSDLGSVSFSQPSGLYEAPVEVVLTSSVEGADIIFTLDGSYPDVDRNPDSTLVYSEPLLIEDRTPEASIWATIDATIPSDLVPSSLSPPPLNADILKVTTVRARVPGGQESVATFAVWPSETTFAHPVVSLIVDGPCLFDEEEGIYVAGSTFREAYDAGEFDPLNPGPRPLPANYLQSGKDWECPRDRSNRNSAWVQVCVAGAVCQEPDPARIRLHGGWTRTNPQKSLRLYANDDVNGERSFPGLASVEGEFEGYRTLLLRMAGGDMWTLWDDFLQSLVSDLSFATQASAPVSVFLNGEYWGLYNLRHRYDADFIAQRYGANPNHVHIIGNLTTVEEGPADAAADFDLTLQYLRDNDPGDPDTVAFVYQKIDIDMFYDFVALNLFVGNTDWPHSNVEMWREVNPPGASGSAEDGDPWKFLVYDLDAGSLTENILEDRFAIPEDYEDQGGYPFLFHRLMENPAERDKFLSRFADLMNSSFHPERTVEILRNFAQRIEPEMPRHLSRWSGSSDTAGWQGFVDARAELLTLRPSEQRQILVEWFQLEGVGEVDIELPVDGGQISVNSIDLTDLVSRDGGPLVWQGLYFSDIPITLRQSTEEGFSFDGWEVTYPGQPPQVLGGSEITLSVGPGVIVKPLIRPST